MHLKLNLIAAACENFGIGLNGDLPWRLKNEMAYFTRMTSTTISPGKKNAVIMGRKTWQSIPKKFRPLADRLNVVLTTDKSMNLGDEAIVCNSLEEAIKKLNTEPMKDSIENIWVIGGSSVYKKAMDSPYCYRVYLTEIMKHFECDTFFPSVGSDFKQVIDSNVPTEKQEENGIEYQFKVYEKINQQ